MAQQSIVVDGAEIHYRDEGSGPVVLFVHGVYVTGEVWSETVAALVPDVRCVVPTWSLGAHEALGPGVDLSAAAAARRIIHLLEALDLNDVTIVANDSGGGLVLTALGDTSLDLPRIGRLVLTNCDSYEHFPPGSFRHIVKLCRMSKRIGGVLLAVLATGGRSGLLPEGRHEPCGRTRAPNRDLRCVRHECRHAARGGTSDRLAGSGVDPRSIRRDRAVRASCEVGVGR